MTRQSGGKSSEYGRWGKLHVVCWRDACLTASVGPRNRQKHWRKVKGTTKTQPWRWDIGVLSEHCTEWKRSWHRAWGRRSTRYKWTHVTQQDRLWLLTLNHSHDCVDFLGQSMIYSLLKCCIISHNPLAVDTSLYVCAWRYSECNIIYKSPVSLIKPPCTGYVTPTATGSLSPHTSLKLCRWHVLVQKLWSAPATGLSESAREGNRGKEKLFC